jgi:hypothetical protein
MVAVCWKEAPGQCESLAVCLCSVLAGVDREIGYDELVAALGLGAAIVAVRGEPPDQWPAFARDAALAPAAQAYGVRLRDLHPPDASRGLSSSVEFSWHFDDSYVPLIRRAIEIGQVALAWRGWPPPRQNLWGLVTAVCGDRLLGYTLGDGGAPSSLVGPSHQVYILEEVAREAPVPSVEETFTRAANLALRCWAGRWSDDPAITSGADAWSALRAAAGEAGGASPERRLTDAMETISAARRGFSGWLRAIADRLEPAYRTVAARWGAALARSAVALEESKAEDAERIESEFHASGELQRVCCL